MGNTESLNEGPYLKKLRPSSFPSQPPLQVQSRVKEPNKGFQGQGMMPYQPSVGQYQFIPPPPQEYLVNSHIKTQSPQLAESVVGSQRHSLTNSQTLPLTTIARNIVSPINSNKKQPLIESETKIVPASETQLDDLPLCYIRVIPETKMSILRKEGQQKSGKQFKIGQKLLDVDGLKLQLRGLQKQVLTKLLPGFDTDIMQMNYLIEMERQEKLKDKNKVLFLLMQRHHYIKVCKKFLEYDQKMKGILLGYRKKGSIEDVTENQLNVGRVLKGDLEKFIKSIEGDLPQKGWTALIEQPESKLYQSVVNSALCNEQIMAKYREIQQSLINPEVFKELVNQEMMESKTRRVGEKIDQNKLIEGPADYGIEPMRNTKHPIA